MSQEIFGYFVVMSQEVFGYFVVMSQEVFGYFVVMSQEVSGISMRVAHVLTYIYILMLFDGCLYDF